MDNYVITFARGFGSGGCEVAAKLAAQLGIKCYENEILTLASQMSGVAEEQFTDVNEKKRISKLMRMLKGVPNWSAKPNAVSKDFVSDDQLFEYQRQIIEQLAQTESCVIVGKCADYILRDYPNVVSVYIEAPRPFCRNRIMSKMGVSAETANMSISQTDRYRAEYYAYYTKGNYWTNPVNYDMTLNSERVGIDRCVDVIRSYLQMKFPAGQF